MRRFLMCVVVGFVFVGLVGAKEQKEQIRDGNWLYGEMQPTSVKNLTPKENMIAAHTYGYILGVWDMATRVGAVKTPEGTQFGQVIDVVWNWLKDNPEKRTDLALLCVLTALQEKWPVLVEKEPVKIKQKGVPM